jgi:hypothetical protein
MIDPPLPRPVARPRTPIGWYWWPLWMLILGGALFFFYVVLTPVWITIRLTAKLSDLAPRRR